jgi:hypothetical protein
MPICDSPVPLFDFGAGHVARCFLYDERTAGERKLPVESAPEVPNSATSAKTVQATGAAAS